MKARQVEKAMAETADQGAVQARGIMRRARSASLATAIVTKDGFPYVSLITVACDMDASPLMLFSMLADHTRNLAHDARASLLFQEASRRANPQTGPRVTVSGKIRKVRDDALARRFLARHPEAQMYAGFADFAFYRMTVERAHWVGGFARARWLPARRILFADKDACTTIAACETDVIEHMNGDHGDALDAYANGLLGRAGTGWAMTGIDPEGIDLRRGVLIARLAFDEPVTSVAACQTILADLAKRARGKTQI
jgi:putative heme iron utilization protein